MSTFNPSAGFTGTPDPLRWADSQALIAAARQAAGGASLDVWPEADFVFVDPLVGDPKLAEGPSDIATISRASKSWSMGWDGVNGNPAGALIEHPSGAASWSPYGLRVAPAAENLIANPRAEGAALPAVPTGWSIQGGAGATITPTGRGVADGWPYVDVTINGTITSNGLIPLVDTAVTALAGNIFTAHVGLALVSGTAPTPNLRLGKDGGSEGANLETTPDGRHRRWAMTRTMTGTPLYARPILYFPPGTYTNAVFRIFTPVLTKTSYVTPPVLPPAGTPGASVKAAETFQIPTSLGWYRHDEGTLIVDFFRAALPGAAGLLSLPEASYWGRQMLYNASVNLVMQAAIQSGGAASGGVIPIAAGRHQAGLRWSGRAHRGAVDGALTPVFTTTADVAAVPTFLSLGAFGTSTLEPSRTPIRRVRFFPRALTDAEMIAATLPYWSV